MSWLRMPVNSIDRDASGASGRASANEIVERWDLVSSAKPVASHDCSPVVTLALSSLSSRVLMTISVVLLRSWPSILHRVVMSGWSQQR